MSKLHFCSNGESVTNQVIKYQQTQSEADYLPIQQYYETYKDHWFSQVDDHIDRSSFESEFEFKLIKAIQSFKALTAAKIAADKGYTAVGAFNGWFFQILLHWKSNVKNSSFRIKKRPSVQCSVCSKHVPRITNEHLQHYKTCRDIAKYFVYDGKIYETAMIPKAYIVCWGVKTKEKWNALLKSDYKKFISDKKDRRWLWFLKGGEKGVFCPLSKNIVKQIDDKYIESLPVKINRYATPMSRGDYVEKYPNSLLQADTYSLDFYTGGDKVDQTLMDYVDKDHRVAKEANSFVSYQDICSGNVPTEYEFVFKAIDDMVPDDADRDVLKLVAAGYVIDDISETLGIDKREVRKRMKCIGNNKSLEIKLQS